MFFDTDGNLAICRRQIILRIEIVHVVGVVGAVVGRRFVCLCLLLCFAGCAGTGSSWSAHWPQQGGFGRAASSAIKDPHTWAPLVGAAVFAATNLDEEVSRKAIENSGVFGDPQGSSNDLRDLAGAAYLLSLIVVPSDSIRDKASGLVLGLSATAATVGVADGLKQLAGRQRPVNDNDQSFPSGHASYTSVVTRLTQNNLSYIDMPAWQRTTLNAGLYGIAIGGAWARVEAGKHFPSDVLAGYALGSFFAAFFQEAFMSGHAGASVSFVPLDQGGAFTVVLPTR